MKTFEDYFTDTSIASMLISIRIKEAMKRHKAVFNQDYFIGQRLPEEEVVSDVSIYLPPRRQWKRPCDAYRKGRPSQDIQRQGLTRHVTGMIRDGSYLEAEWGRRLLGLCEEVRMRVSDPASLVFTPPKVKTIDKPPSPKINRSPLKVAQPTSYRAIAYYTDLADRLIIGLTAKYLTHELDDLLSPCLYSFRKNALITHNTAVRHLKDYRQAAGERTLYVAETDIRKFFDVVHHQVIVQAVSTLAKNYAGRKGCEMDVRALSVVDAYLRSYTFRDNVLGSNDPMIQERIKGIDRVDEQTLQQIYGNTWAEERIGIPQGGALSTVLTNIVLDVADRAVTQPHDPGLFYARFCDDILILHQDKEACQAALDRYCTAVRQLNLPAHPAQTFTSPSHFFECKSKKPYIWGARPPEGNLWINFLGYHVHRNGSIRLRRETLDRHLGKIEREFEELNRHFDRLGRKGLKQTAAKTMSAVVGRILAMGTGRQTFRAAHPNTRQISWFDFFTELEMNPFSVGQMKILDRYRTSQFLKLKNRLQQNIQTGGHTLGCPFSYFGALTKRWATRLVPPSEIPRAERAAYGRDY